MSCQEAMFRLSLVCKDTDIVFVVRTSKFRNCCMGIQEFEEVDDSLRLTARDGVSQSKMVDGEECHVIA